jgi:hypothetical protein
MFNLFDPKTAVSTRRGKNTLPVALPRPKPVSLRATKRTLAQQLGVRPDVSKEADKLEKIIQKKKEADAPPAVRLPVPTAIQVMAPDPIRDSYLERAKTAQPKEIKPVPAVKDTATIQQYADALLTNKVTLDQTAKTTPSLMDQLKNFGG